jgi:hypothetical protein
MPGSGEVIVKLQISLNELLDHGDESFSERLAIIHAHILTSSRYTLPIRAWCPPFPYTQGRH